jgi:hypothetical protein
MSPPDNTIRSIRPVDLPRPLSVTRQHDRDDNADSKNKQEKQRKKRRQLPQGPQGEETDLEQRLQGKLETDPDDDEQPGRLDLLA